MVAENHTPTPHNSAVRGEIAKTVIMPGDPLRAKYIAETFLQNARLYNQVRGIFGYTGLYKGLEVSVQAHGMGIPSIGIYTYELYNFYDVENIIRVGSAGAMQPGLKLGDIVAALGACTDSDYAAQYNLPGTFAPTCTYHLLEKAAATARALQVPLHIGNILSSDIFYHADPDVNKKWAEMGVLAVEMEAAGLYCNAAKAGKNALCLTTISDQIITGERMSVEQRQLGFKAMVELALEMLC